MALKPGSVAQRVYSRHNPMPLSPRPENQASEERALKAFIDDPAFEKWFRMVERIVKSLRRIALVEKVDDAQRLDAVFAVQVIGKLITETYLSAGMEVPDAVREIFE